MGSFNRVILLGNLTRDPELKYLPNNTAVCEFSLAINYKYRDRDGNMKEEVCFVDVSAFGRRGENINQYLSKGKPILVEGRLKHETWTAQDGTKRSKHSVIVDNSVFVGSREGSGGGGAPAQSGWNRDAAPQPAPADGGSGQPAPAEGGSGPPAGVANDYASGPPSPEPPSGGDIPF